MKERMAVNTRCVKSLLVQKRIYARYYLGMRVSEIATAEGVDQSRVRDSIRRGLKQLAKYF